MTKKELLKTINEYTPSSTEEVKYKIEILNYLENTEVFQGKKNINGHMTGGAWIVNKDRTKTLLVFHKKLNKWLQPAGHVEEKENIFDASLREGYEETGLKHLKSLSEEIFDIDVHKIPGYKNEKEHIHYAIRYIFEADENERLVISDESVDLKWIGLAEIKKYSDYSGTIRMVEKTLTNISTGTSV